ncbi:MAG: LysR family transcriptional regulator [Sphingomonadaceae bacterium]|nr:LysR family transcriptional regulator [Sphingomonadaceae bacterium]
MERLPSLTSLQLLNLAAQHRSLSVAAAKAGMTQPAASRRLAGLECLIGTALLHRHRRGVELTEAGVAYLAAVSPALDAIVAATEARRSANRSAPLRLRVYSTFAARWLLPRLPDFQASHPDIEVRLDTTVSPVAFERDDADVAIQFGEGEWPTVDCRLLIEDIIEPVCSRDYAARNADAIVAGQLAGMLLLHSRYRRLDWRDWAVAADRPLAGARFMPFPSSLLSYQAAIEGVGMAIAQTGFLAAELGSGTLVRPFDRPLRRPAGYYLVTPRGSEPDRVRAFRRWIIRAAAKS